LGTYKKGVFVFLPSLWKLDIFKGSSRPEIEEAFLVSLVRARVRSGQNNAGSGLTRALLFGLGLYQAISKIGLWFGLLLNM
jgi:hypothetical protein